MNYNNQNNLVYSHKMTQMEIKKVEQIKQTINKSNARNASINWRKHIPVYGWTTMNYPTTICPPITEKYIKKQKEYEEKEKEKMARKASLDTKLLLFAEKIEPLYDPNNKYRLNPDKVNDEVLKDSKLNKFFTHYFLCLHYQYAINITISQV